MIKTFPVALYVLFFLIIIILSGVRLSPLGTSATNWTNVPAPSSNPGCRGGEPVPNRLSYGAANTVRKYKVKKVKLSLCLTN
jgi:hypothetical protein